MASGPSPRIVEFAKDQHELGGSSRDARRGRASVRSMVAIWVPLVAPSPSAALMKAPIICQACPPSAIISAGETGEPRVRDGQDFFRPRNPSLSQVSSLPKSCSNSVNDRGLPNELVVGRKRTAWTRMRGSTCRRTASMSAGNLPHTWRRPWVRRSELRNGHPRRLTVEAPGKWLSPCG